MPSPVGHSLIGLAIGLAYALPRCRPGRRVSALSRHAWLIVFAVILANTPDLDYIPGLFMGDWNAYHHGYTHTLAWVAIVGLGVWLAWKATAPAVGWGALIFVFFALASHLAADLVTDDGRLPYGIMVAWPLSSEHVLSPVTIFWRLEKMDLADVFQIHNFWAVLVEVLWTLPLVVVVLIYKSRKSNLTASHVE